jgi:hypothetical protein
MVRIPGEHVPNIKNRSSKQNILLTKKKSAMMSLSNEALIKYDKMYNGRSNSFGNELSRRSKNAAKRKTPRPKTVKDEN